MRFSPVLAGTSFVILLGFAQTGLSQSAVVQNSSTESSFAHADSAQDISKQEPSQNHSDQIRSKNTLAPFTTDGCSMWIDGTPRQPSLWRHCCVAHDKAYWIGGTAQERHNADQALNVCVSDLAGKTMGNYMYTFVVPGGSPYWIMPYRWGYGWNYLDNGKPRGYKTLTEDELEQVNALLSETEKTIAEDAIEHPASFKIPEKK